MKGVGLSPARRQRRWVPAEKDRGCCCCRGSRQPPDLGARRTAAMRHEAGGPHTHLSRYPGPPTTTPSAQWEPPVIAVSLAAVGAVSFGHVSLGFKVRQEVVNRLPAWHGHSLVISQPALPAAAGLLPDPQLHRLRPRSPQLKRTGLHLGGVLTDQPECMHYSDRGERGSPNER